MEALLIVIFLAGFLAALGSIVAIGLRHGPRLSFASLPVQAHAIPHRRRPVFFSKAERSFYKTLRAVVPDHMIFTKVRLTDLVALNPKHSFWEFFSPMNRQHIDFVVCDATLAPVLAIELDGQTNIRAAEGKADLVSSVLATASLPVVHVPQRRRYLFSELRRLLTPYLGVPRPIV